MGGPLIYDYGLCTVAPNFLSPDLVAACLNQTLDFQKIMEEQISETPDVPYAYIQSKADIVQQSFYVAIGLTTGTSAFIDPELFYAGVNSIFAAYNKASNFLTYLVDGGQHCFTNQNVYYSADALGPNDDGASTGEEMMYTWTGSYPLDAGEVAYTVCEGEYEDLPGDKRPHRNEVSPDYRVTYCNTSVAPKEMVAS